MKAEEIREFGFNDVHSTMLREIAAQFAEHNENERKIMVLLERADARNERESERNQEIREIEKRKMEAEIRLIEARENMWKPSAEAKPMAG